MGVRFLCFILCAGLVCPLIGSWQVSAEPQRWWDSEWSFRQEINIPFDTGGNFSAYQPVDTTVVFLHPCWTENETHSSIRVICQGKNADEKLESQIYNLVHSDAEHITSCSLVFLIPPGADGTERYYIYYNEARTAPPEYPDHVSITESSYFYEPIPGYPVESHFYEVIQNSSIMYAIAQDGTYLYYTTAQYVTKLAPGATEMNLQTAQTAASFEFAYYYGDEMWQYYSTSQELISKEILCDGNLMVSCRIISQSTAHDVQTTAVYKYFYCPTSATRIHAHVVHEALKECQVYPGTNTDGTYAAMQCGVMKSQSIAALNFGKLYPYIHVSSERNIIEEYRVDLHPEYNKDDPVIRLLQTTDDVDLGQKAWTSYDDGSTGTVHALIFGSSSVVKAGADERDGIQVKAYESDYPHLPGLTYTIAGFQFTRNIYEKNVSEKDTVIPQGFTAEFDAEFFSSPAGGYPLADQETTIFQALVTLIPKPTSESLPRGNETTDQYGLTVFLHNAPSFPFGSALSALIGRPFPYLTVEVYRDETLVYTGTASRIPLRPITSTENASLHERLTSLLHMLDFRNSSLWKKISFQGLSPDRYSVKVFRENPRIRDERQFIGFTTVDLTQNKTIHIWCHPQASCQVSVVDQDDAGVYGAQVILLCQGRTVSQNMTNEQGVVQLTAPCSIQDQYTLEVHYQGFEVANESFFLRGSRAIIPFKLSLEINQYDWTVHLIDLWGLPPGVEVRPFLMSAAMNKPMEIFGEQTRPGAFLFSRLIPAQYQFQCSYKSFVVEQEVTIPTEAMTVVFPAVYPVSFRVLDSHGNPASGVTIRLSREQETMNVSSNGSRSVVSVPPGTYQVSILSSDQELIGQRMLDVLSDRNIDMITTQEPVFPWIVLAVSVLLICAGVLLSWIKRDPLYVFMLSVIGVGMVTLVYPWWSLQGSSAGVQTSSSLYLVPLDLVSMTVTPQVVAGEFAYFPPLFATVMLTVVTLMVISWCCLGGSFVLRRRISKPLFIVVVGSSLVLMIVSLVMFLVAMSAFTEVGVGSVLGRGTVDVLIQGDVGIVPVLCQWGPGTGFWLSVVSIGILACALVIMIQKKRNKKL
jgi:hypothetical protein